MTGNLLITALLSGGANAGSTWLANDTFSGQGNIFIQDGFATYECWASVFETDSLATDGALTMKSIRTLIGGSSANNFFIVQFYAMAGSSMNSAALLGEEGVSMTGSTKNYNDLEISDLKIGLPTINSGNVAVAMCFDETSTTTPSIANTDGFGSSSQSNWIYLFSTNTWMQSADLSVQGDWIMRLCVEADHISGSCDDSSDTVDGGGDGAGDGSDDGSDDGGSDTGSDAVSLLQITPDSAAEGEAVDVVLIGSGFAAGTEARIGGISLTGTEVVNAETISGRTPTSLPAGSHDVEIVLPNGENDYIAGGFTVGGGCGCASSTMPMRQGWLVLIGALLVLRRRLD